MRRLGSGEMTVRAEKSTRLPDKLPRKRPDLPFNRWQRPLIGLSCAAAGPCLAKPGSSPFKYCATWTCKKFQHSMMILIDPPLSIEAFKETLTSMISCSLMVKSSSFDPPPGPSTGTEGRIGVGGTRSEERIKSCGFDWEESHQSSSQSSFEILSKMRRTSNGVRIVDKAFAWLFTSSSSPPTTRAPPETPVAALNSGAAAKTLVKSWLKASNSESFSN
mmetsp:Transcript_29454/g.99219  ORF Transcript_29454/g.99219 Transcript_29454/m.99219 type:complete len:219 (-) Transcript_29454:657-1313(-)